MYQDNEFVEADVTWQKDEAELYFCSSYLAKIFKN